jgi:hypothetical protein
METKWLAIMWVGIVAAMFTPLAVSEHGKSQCRIEAIKAGVEADKINTACGVK